MFNDDPYEYYEQPWLWYSKLAVRMFLKAVQDPFWLGFWWGAVLAAFMLLLVLPWLVKATASTPEATLFHPPPHQPEA